MSIEEVRSWFVARGCGFSPAEQLFYERLAGLLRQDERPEDTTLLRCEDVIGRLVLTDRRLLHIGDHPKRGMVVTTVPRADVTGIKVTGLLIPRVTISHREGTLHLAGSSKAWVAGMVQALGY